MTTSVPQVTSFNDVLYRLGELLQKSARAKREAPAIYIATVQLIRRVYEEEMKPMANLGELERAYVDEVGRAIEKVEAKLPNAL